MANNNASANGLITRFKFQKLLNQDQGGRRAVLQGTISGEPALLLAERAAFSNDESYLSSFSRLITHVNNLGANDIYHWYMANCKPDGTLDQPTPPDLKINLIYPCQDSHIRKYSFQQSRVVLETPSIYANYVRPYMQQYREKGKLNWVFNILEGRKEQENVLYRSKEAETKDDFLLLPDLNWDRTTIGSLHLLALVERRDIWSVRDLKKKDVIWLRHLRSTLTKAVETLYEGVENDMLKFYVHCAYYISQMMVLLHTFDPALTLLPRPTHVLPLPHPCRPREPRPHRNTGCGKSARLRQCHLATRDHGRWRRRRNGRCRAFIHRRRGQ
jgi:m7GpppX diphosphatase